MKQNKKDKTFISNLVVYDNGYNFWMKDDNNKAVHFVNTDNVLYINGVQVFERG